MRNKLFIPICAEYARLDKKRQLERIEKMELLTVYKHQTRIDSAKTFLRYFDDENIMKMRRECLESAVKNAKQNIENVKAAGGTPEEVQAAIDEYCEILDICEKYEK